MKQISYSPNVLQNFTIEDLELFHHYLFIDIMEMYDLKKYPLDNTDGCPYYHCMPRFVCNLPGDCFYRSRVFSVVFARCFCEES